MWLPEKLKLHIQLILCFCWRARLWDGGGQAVKGPSSGEEDGRGGEEENLCLCLYTRHVKYL